MGKELMEKIELYKQFQEKFSLEKIRTMTLDEYNNTNRSDSFCYWVETRLKSLGSIQGATSYKFGIYKYDNTPRDDSGYSHDEKYAWLSKFGNTATEVYHEILSKIISIAEAARKGDIETIENIDISNMFKWKIAFLYSELNFLNIFAEDSLRFLTKKYGLDNYKKATFAEMYRFLLKLKNNESMFEFGTRLWNEWISSDEYKKKSSNDVKFWSGGIKWGDEDKLQDFSDNSYWQIGWDKYDESKGAKQAWKNIKVVKIGDYIAFHGYGGQNDLKIYQISQVIDKDEENGKIFIEKMNKDDDVLFHGKAPKMDQGGWFGTLFEITGKEAIEKIFGNQIQGESPMSEEVITKYTELLKKSRNLILTGAPGTGKTYLAQQIAEKMGCEKYNIGFVQFHPSYDYTDFVEGLRPKQNDNNNDIGFERKDGVFKEFCARALKNLTKPFVFIIDEINRGEVAKIFGELFFSVDPGYRITGQDLEDAKAGIKTITTIKTQYANLESDGNDFDRALGTKDYGHFFIPENLYIIGTMNDIDRSVESMDFAFRRRFTWAEIEAKETQYMLDSPLGDLAEQAKEKMNRLNQAISAIPQLNSAYHIGASYFLKLQNFSQDDCWENLWHYHLEGILKEYLRGNPQASEELAKLKAVYEG